MIKFILHTGFYLLLLFHSCNQNSIPYERSEYLIQYLKNIHHIESKNNDIYWLIIVNASGCGNCDKAFVRFINEELNALKKNGYIIFSEKTPLALEMSKQLNVDKDNILFDHNEQLPRYGLSAINNLFFIISKNRIIYFNELREDTFSKIKKQVNKLYFPISKSA